MLLGRVAERFGVRPSDLLEGDLEHLLFDAKVVEVLSREDAKELRRMRRRAG